MTWKPKKNTSRISYLHVPAGLFKAVARLLLVTLAGCSAMSPAERNSQALTLITAANWQSATVLAGRFELLAAYPTPRAVDTLAVFIEGDGLAWLDMRTPSPDPTPRDPTALRLALAEPHRTSAYLARPCQFGAGGVGKLCTPADWTDARYSAEVVSSMDAGVSQLKRTFGARRVVLVGYSGGGAIAALVAQRRTDVTLLVTVAAVLDHRAWTQHHGISPLTGSLNPADGWALVRETRQVHWVGGDDTQTGLTAVQPYVDRFPSGNKPALLKAPGFTHTCCWVDNWPRLSPR